MDGYVVIGTEIDTKGFDKQIKEIEYELKQIDYELSHKKELKLDSRTISEYEAKAQKLGNQLEKLREKQNDLNKGNLANMTQQVNNVGNSVKGVTKKILGWGLALIGIRSIISLVRQSFNTLAEYNDQLSSDIEYIRFALANTLAPVIQWIMGLVKKLMYYVGYIAKAWFGVDIYANSSANAFKNAKDNLSKSAKSAKELNKQLAGFDEMNVLSDSSSSGSDSGGGGTTLPSFDLSSMQGEPPAWLKWIVDNKDLILSVMAGIAAGLLAWKLGLGGIKALGIGIAIGGIVYAIQSLLEYLKDPSWQNFGKIIQGIGVFVIGLGIAFASLPVIITGAVILIVGTIIKYWEQIKAFLQKGIDWLLSKSDWIRQTFGNTVGDIYDIFVGMLQMLLNGFDNVFKGLKQILDGIIKFVKGVFTGNWKQAWEGIKQIFSGIFQSLLGVVQAVLGTIIGLVVIIGKTVGSIIAGAFKAVVNAILGAIESILNNPIRAINGLIKIINKIPGIDLGKGLKEFKLPRLAKGGIINQPGRGVPIGSAIAGERGQEGVIPLTDSQQMELLGETIGRYITVNANITNTMNGRVISRELQKINNENDFAYNR